MGIGERLEQARARLPWLDHAIRAQQRYDGAKGDFCAAAVTYFTIFAMFPLLMVGFAGAGFVLARKPALLAEMDQRVKAAVSGDFAEQLISLIDAAIDSRTSVGLIGLATALWAGLNWMTHLRGALTQMWAPDTPAQKGATPARGRDAPLRHRPKR